LAPVIENQTFRLATGVDAAAFVADDARVQQEIAYQQRGIVRRTTAVSADGEWLVTTLWTSAAEADAAAPVLDALAAHIDASTLRTTRYDELPG
ncbi:MAG: hypothetical protein QOD30_591, partial [Actinomycetota bacterium]|nr:hypothetical protein [Actinomycetota bacterium]